MSFEGILTQASQAASSLGSSNWIYALLVMFVLPFARMIFSPLLIIFSSFLNSAAIILAQLNRTIATALTAVFQFVNSLLFALTPKAGSKVPLIVTASVLGIGIVIGYLAYNGPHSGAAAQLPHEVLGEDQDLADYEAF